MVAKLAVAHPGRLSVITHSEEGSYFDQASRSSARRTDGLDLFARLDPIKPETARDAQKDRNLVSRKRETIRDLEPEVRRTGFGAASKAAKTCGPRRAPFERRLL